MVMLDRLNYGLGWLQSTPMAMSIGNSLYLLAGLSALHLVGFTLLMGSALVGNLRLLGVMLPDLAIADVVRPARRALAAGLTISLVTGFLLFSTRATNAVGNEIFRLKMALLVAAALVHFVVQSRFAGDSSGGGRFAPAAGALGLLLWISVGVAGCAFIFLE
jgi:hypothetical protein